MKIQINTQSGSCPQALSLWQYVSKDREEWTPTWMYSGELRMLTPCTLISRAKSSKIIFARMKDDLLNLSEQSI